jgi:hypothetical protein
MNIIHTILKTLVYKIVFDVAVYTIVLVLLLCVSGVDCWCCCCVCQVWTVGVAAVCVRFRL